METYKCEYTGRTFTNVVLYRAHVKTWPDICKRNGLQLDGKTPLTAKKEKEEIKQEEPKQEKEVKKLPVGFPAKSALSKAGIKNLDDVPRNADDLVAISGIGKATAENILSYFEEESHGSSGN